MFFFYLHIIDHLNIGQLAEHLQAQGTLISFHLEVSVGDDYDFLEEHLWYYYGDVYWKSTHLSSHDVGIAIRRNVLYSFLLRWHLSGE